MHQASTMPRESSQKAQRSTMAQLATALQSETASAAPIRESSNKVLTFRMIRIDEMFHRSKDLSVANYEEASSYFRELDLNVNWVVYKNFDAMGLVKWLGAFDKTEMVGYAVFVEAPNLFHCQTKMGICSVIYLDPKYRRGSAGVRFIKYVENVARALDCNYMQF